MLSATIERMTQRSSTQFARCGNNSLTSVPHWPYFWNFQGDWSRFPVLVLSNLGLSNGSGLPLSSIKRGFGSNVSTGDGPPDITSKITRFALAEKWPGRTARGSIVEAQRVVSV